MFNASKNATPVTAVERFVNNPSCLNVNSLAFDDFVIYATKQFENEGLISYIWMRPVPSLERVLFRRRIGFVAAPRFGLVLKHLFLVAHRGATVWKRVDVPKRKLRKFKPEGFEKPELSVLN